MWHPLPPPFFRLAAMQQSPSSTFWPWIHQPTIAVQLMVWTPRAYATRNCSKANLLQPAMIHPKPAMKPKHRRLLPRQVTIQQGVQPAELPEVNKHGNQNTVQNSQVLEFFPNIPLPDVPVSGRLKYFKSKW